MSLANLAGISIYRSNKTFKLPSADGEDGGIAQRPDPVLVKAVHKLTSARKSSAGKVTVMLRNLFKADIKASNDNKKRKREEKEKKSIQAEKNKAERANTALETDLCETTSQLQDEIAAFGSRKTEKVKFMKAQIRGRMVRAKSLDLECPISAVGARYRSEKTGKIVVTAPSKGEEVDYFTNLASALMARDASAPQVVSFSADSTIRSLPSICPASAFATSTKAKDGFEKKIGGIVAVQDDADLVELRSKYYGKMCYDS